MEWDMEGSMGMAETAWEKMVVGMETETETETVWEMETAWEKAAVGTETETETEKKMVQNRMAKTEKTVEGTRKTMAVD
jgi:hypothetical protein